MHGLPVDWKRRHISRSALGESCGVVSMFLLQPGWQNHDESRIRVGLILESQMPASNTCARACMWARVGVFVFVARIYACVSRRVHDQVNRPVHTTGKRAQRYEPQTRTHGRQHRCWLPSHTPSDISSPWNRARWWRLAASCWTTSAESMLPLPHAKGGYVVPCHGATAQQKKQAP